MSRFAHRLGFPALSLVCVITLGWPHAVRASAYRMLYPLVALDPTTLAASPAELTALGYVVDDPADLARFRDVAAPVVAGIQDDGARIRRLADLIYSYHPGRTPLPLIPGGRERGVHAIFSEIESGKFPLCGQKTIVLAAMWRSLGGDVRQIRFSEGEDIAWYAAHYGIEVYSHQWRKWFYFDATLNGFGVKPSGEPLSLLEINDRIGRGGDVEMRNSAEYFDWDTQQFLSSVRANRLQVYSLDNRLRGQDPDRRFGPLNFGYSWLSQLPRPFDKVVDAVTGDATRRFVAVPGGLGLPTAAPVQLTANRSGRGPSLSDQRPAAPVGRGRHRRSF